VRALIVGLGSIGRRHLKNLRKLEPAADITVLRRPGSDLRAEGADRVIDDPRQALELATDIAILAGPAPTHVPMARALCGKGTSLLIEKPLSDTLDGVDDLLADAQARGIVLMVGYCLRFHGALRGVREAVASGRIGRLLFLECHVGQDLRSWRPGVDYRDSVSAHRATGGGVLLELSHELDSAQWIAGEVDWVSAEAARVGDLDVDVEDVATVTLRFSSGARGCVHLDMLDLAPRRGGRAVGTLGTLEWDLLAPSLRLLEGSSRTWVELPVDVGELYESELAHFLSCVRTGSPPEVTGDDGRRALQLAVAAAESARTGRGVRLSS
jgi:predicted dehydrogenase